MLALAARLTLIAAALSCGLAPTRLARAHLPAGYGGKLEAPLCDQPLTFDPALARRPSELQLASLRFDTLFVIKGGRPAPLLLAEAPQRGANGLSMSLVLRDDVLAHDGKPLTVGEVAASLQAARRGPHRHLFAAIKNVSAPNQRLLIELRRPEPRLELLLATPASAIALRRGGRLMGTGPFAMARHSATRVQLTAHAKYFAGRPYLRRLGLRVFRRTSEEAAALQVGAAQLSFHGASVFGGRPRHPTATLDVPSLRTIYLATGKRRPYLDDAAARRMLSAAIDRLRLARVAGALARPAHELVDPRIGLQRGKRLYDRALATRLRRALAKRFSAWREPRASASLLVDRSRPADDALVAQLVADLDRVGLTLQLEKVSARAYARRVARRDYDLALVQHAPQLAEAHLALAGVLAMGGMQSAAAECAAARCDLSQGAQLVGKLPLVPLVHLGRRIHHDLRVAGLRALSSGRVGYAELFWLRKTARRR